MKRNCYLDLRLHSSSAYSPSHHSYFCRNGTLKLDSGRHYFLDIAELQARVIIWSASREILEERSGLQSQALLMYVSRGLSIKKSLQSFLQKRKKRSQRHISIDNHNDRN